MKKGAFYLLLALIMLPFGLVSYYQGDWFTSAFCFTPVIIFFSISLCRFIKEIVDNIPSVPFSDTEEDKTIQDEDLHIW